jgi:hypothetical protein
MWCRIWEFFSSSELQSKCIAIDRTKEAIDTPSKLFFVNNRGILKSKNILNGGDN